MSTNGHFFNNCFTIYQKQKIELLTLLPFSIPYSFALLRHVKRVMYSHIYRMLFAFLTILSFFSWRLFLSKAVYIFCQKCVPIPINLLHFLNKHVFILNIVSQCTWFIFSTISFQVINIAYLISNTNKYLQNRIDILAKLLSYFALSLAQTSKVTNTELKYYFIYIYVNLFHGSLTFIIVLNFLFGLLKA